MAGYELRGKEKKRCGMAGCGGNPHIPQQVFKFLPRNTQLATRNSFFSFLLTLLFSLVIIGIVMRFYDENRCALKPARHNGNVLPWLDEAECL